MTPREMVIIMASHLWVLPCYLSMLDPPKSPLPLEVASNIAPLVALESYETYREHVVKWAKAMKKITTEKINLSNTSHTP